MLKGFCFILLLLILITACSSASVEESTSAVTNPTDTTWHMNNILTPTLSPNGAVVFVVDGVEISIHKPANWELFPTQDGVILSENVGGIEQVGVLRGMFIYVWVPPLESVSEVGTGVPSLPPTANAAAAGNLAWNILNNVITDPVFIGDASAFAPVAFEWDNHDAAYYLANERNEKVMIVLGVMLSGSQRMVASTIAAPANNTPEMRAVVLQMLGSLRVGDHTFSAETLAQHLPDPLQFPDYQPAITQNSTP